MEERESCSWNTASNWIVANGDLKNSVSFESSASPVEEDAVVGSGDLLVLNSPPTDAGPCEITVTFGQEHEVRQVYVKSTARIYEIYYLPCNQSCNEYLCTVRCGVAANEERLFNVGDTREAPKHAECSEVKDKAENKSSSSEEDGWVEVKNSECSSSCNSDKYNLEEVDYNIGRANQDFYEATAEITDAGPCVSITLRLLSLHSKGCVHIDNVYLFADPSDFDESGPQVGSAESSAGSSLLTMLVPSLLQLSKSESHRTHERNTSDILLQNNVQGGMHMTKPIHHEIRNTIEQEYNSSTSGLQEGRAHGSFVEGEERTKVTCQKQILEPASKEEKLESSGLERVLNQLDSRIGRIEAFCSRFEETMLKLLDSTERRFQHLEQRLDTLAVRNTPNSTVFVSSRIAAPEFSCEESETNSLQKDNNEVSSRDSVRNIPASTLFVSSRIAAPEFSCEESETNSLQIDNNEVSSHDSVKDSRTSLQDNSGIVKNLEASLQDDDAISSLHLHPSLVVTAPEFSNDDESDSGDEIPALVEKDPPVKKRAVSIDDAIASALSALTVASNKSHELHPPSLDTSGNMEFGLPFAAVELKDTKDPGFASPDRDDTKKLPMSDHFQKDLDFESQENPQANCVEEALTPERRMEQVDMDKLGTSTPITDDDEVPCGAESNPPSSVTPDTETVRPTVLSRETLDTEEKGELHSTGAQETEEMGKICSSENQETDDAKIDTSPMAEVECQKPDGEDREATETGTDQGPTSNLEPSVLDVKFVAGDGGNSSLPLEALLYDTMPLPAVVTEVQASEGEERDASVDTSGDSHILGLDAGLLIETGRLDSENVPSEITGSNGFMEPLPSLI
ncbi:hypothetical protein H6P81_009384 [Aristolochia fimbriata]|uniref:Uncharacterized protein n=1 Tax=Aristolochia fimbriata TaxID=158543 RepID=A0AAV7EL94_ARIFI|nr:hypothetical protein H6P81_009384 [Aristolochia fimbriata]